VAPGAMCVTALRKFFPKVSNEDRANGEPTDFHQEMLKRVARFKELVPSEYVFVDSKIPGHERLIYNVIGNGVTEDASLRPAVPDACDFNLTYVKAEPDKVRRCIAI
jgi:hypothetical protein